MAVAKGDRVKSAGVDDGFHSKVACLLKPYIGFMGESPNGNGFTELAQFELALGLNQAKLHLSRLFVF